MRTQQNTQDLHTKEWQSLTTTEPQKIVASNADPPMLLPKTDVVASPPRALSSLPQFITQEDQTMAPSFERHADNTRAQKSTWILMQDFAPLALKQCFFDNRKQQ